ncbi:MAG: IGHMBP2 family helicase [Saprospiraceae bacterium]|nr:IGHMBP2 family helicase [Saprospiraceae bacterium]
MIKENDAARLHKLLLAIESERTHDELFYKSMQEKNTIKDKLNAGFLWYPVEIIRSSYTVGDYVEVELKRNKSGPENHRFTEGIAVSIFNIQTERTDIRGTVSSVRNDLMRVVVQSGLIEKDGISDKGNTGVEMIYDDRPYKVMTDAVNDVLKSPLMHIQSINQALFQGEFTQELLPNSEDINFECLNKLNQSQKEAVKMGIRIPFLGIIHGPPGTGKTTTLVALAEVLLQNEKRILVCAPSNNAVDLMADKLNSRGISVLRIGNITRIHDDLIHLTIDEKVRNHPDWAHIKKVRIQARETEKKASQFKRQFGAAEKDNRSALRKEARDLRKWASELEDRLINSLIRGAQVIATTLIGVSNRVIKDLFFETVIIDEASQALEPECWNAILKAKRVILAGDHKQLPPTVKSKEAMKLGFDRTILDTLSDKINECILLDTQYRMHGSIMSFSNLRFYKSKLLSDSGVVYRSLRNDTLPLVFIDTAGCGFDELSPGDSRSYLNEGEYNIIREHILLHIEKFAGCTIGIISPYKDQVRYIRQQIVDDIVLNSLDIEVNSIDGFQGQEKEIIYISLVRCNDIGDIGFLKDERRLNVAMTRAQKKLIILGDSATIAQHEIYASLIAHVEAQGHYDSAWNYMNY